MYVTYCKVCTLSSIITENILDVCKPLHVTSFSPNLVFMIKSYQWAPHKRYLGHFT
ncbi:hypothetical protein Hanom_Chr05g00457761 [Helianthus anomalus]